MKSSITTSLGLSTHPSTIKSHLLQTSVEFVGTTIFLLLSFTATQSILPTSSAALTQLYISLSFSLSLYTTILIMTPLSPCSFNPAINLSLLLTRRLPPLLFATFTAAQLLGGITASVLAAALLPGDLGLAQHPLVSAPAALALEILLTLALCLVVLRNGTPGAVAATLAMGHLVGVGFSGASMNPARTMGPAVVTGRWGDGGWVYWVGPMVGGGVAGGAQWVVERVGRKGAVGGEEGVV